MDKNSLLPEILWRHVLEQEAGTWAPHPAFGGSILLEGVAAYSLSISCNHCGRPTCTASCPAGAISKGADGVVTIDQDRCSGSRLCETECPYGALQYDPTVAKATKCDFCSDLLSLGEPPACVDACVMRALGFGELEELQKRFGPTTTVAPLAPRDVTRPSLFLLPPKPPVTIKQSGPAVLESRSPKC